MVCITDSSKTVHINLLLLQECPKRLLNVHFLPLHMATKLLFSAVIKTLTSLLRTFQLFSVISRIKLELLAKVFKPFMVYSFQSLSNSLTGRWSICRHYPGSLYMLNFRPCSRAAESEPLWLEPVTGDSVAC